jgi:hypothetical protein
MMQDACFRITMKSGTGLETNLMALIRFLGKRPVSDVCRRTFNPAMIEST